MFNCLLRILILCSIALLSSCSVTQIQPETRLKAALDSSARYKLDSSVTIKASRAADTQLRADTTWYEVGRLDEGVVYRTKDQVVIVNSFNVHEGYIVVRGDQVTGYYLPIEKTFVQSQPADISLTKMEHNDEN